MNYFLVKTRSCYKAVYCLQEKIAEAAFLCNMQLYDILLKSIEELWGYVVDYGNVNQRLNRNINVDEENFTPQEKFIFCNNVGWFTKSWMNP